MGDAKRVVHFGYHVPNNLLLWIGLVRRSSFFYWLHVYLLYRDPSESQHFQAESLKFEHFQTNLQTGVL